VTYAKIATHTGLPEVEVRDADGKNARTLGRGMMPAFSPDGTKILYTRVAPGPQFEPSLGVMDADGTNSKEVVPRCSFMGSWSPDGKHLLYVGWGAGSGGKCHIYTCKADGSDPKPLTEFGNWDLGMSWSSDGKHIYINRSKPGGKTWAICVMDAGGGNEQEVVKSCREMLGGLGWEMIFLPRGVWDR
jgi:Tol biopolymer transport system component